MVTKVKRLKRREMSKVEKQVVDKVMPTNLIELKAQIGDIDKILSIDKPTKVSDGNINTQLKVSAECPKIKVKKKHFTIKPCHHPNQKNHQSHQ